MRNGLRENAFTIGGASTAAGVLMGLLSGPGTGAAIATVVAVSMSIAQARSYQQARRRRS